MAHGQNVTHAGRPILGGRRRVAKHATAKHAMLTKLSPSRAGRTHQPRPQAAPVARAASSRCRILSASADIPGVEIRRAREEGEEAGPDSAALSSTCLAEARQVVPEPAATVPSDL